MLKKFHIENNKAVETPLASNYKLSKKDGASKTISSTYKSIIGSLLYLTTSRLDIMFLASLISRFMQKPSQNHYSTTKQALRYIKGTIDFSLRFEKKESSELISYCDSDWVKSVDDSKSTKSYCFFFRSAIFS